MGTEMYFWTIVFFLGAIAALVLTSGALYAFAARRCHAAEIRLVIVPGKECNISKVLSAAGYVRDNFFPQMVIELAEGRDDN